MELGGLPNSLALTEELLQFTSGVMIPGTRAALLTSNQSYFSDSSVIPRFDCVAISDYVQNHYYNKKEQFQCVLALLLFLVQLHITSKAFRKHA